MTTTHRKKTTASGVILAKENEGLLLTKQQVVAAGPNAPVKVGDWVELDVDKFPKRKVKAKYDTGPDSYEIVPPAEMVDDKLYLFVSSREIKWIYEGKDD